MREVVVFAVLGAAGCGGPARPAPAAAATPAHATAPAHTPAPAKQPGAANDELATLYCAHIGPMADECPPFAKLRPDPATCTDTIKQAMVDANDTLAAIVRCVSENESCQDAAQCVSLSAPKSDTSDGEHRRCGDRGELAATHAVDIPRPEWDHRNGAGVTRYAGAKSTKDRPIEMCGIHAANDWLIALRCDDGTQPIHDVGEAETARAGNVGPGGRCGAIIDNYVVACPERTYQVYIDAYMCPAP